MKAGDRVLFGKWSGTEVKIDGEDLLIMKESDIMGVIETGAAEAAGQEESRVSDRTTPTTCAQVPQGDSAQIVQQFKES